MQLQSNKMIFIVDDDKNVRRSLQVAFENNDFKVQTFHEPLIAFNKIKENAPDLLVLDIRMGDISGIDLFRKLLSEGLNIPVIFMSAQATSTEAVNAVKMGAFDFLEKPFSPEKLIITINHCLELIAAKNKISELNSKTENTSFLGQTKVFKNLLAEINKVAMTNSPVLITGESGTGKELIAKEIHSQSKLSDKIFVKVNCSAIPEHLIESELFGYVKGAFTGAEKNKKGYFEAADGGTLFLDEIGEMSLSAQAKVLRVIQNMEIQKLGSEEITHVKVRVITATNRNLEEEIKKKTFREDLYYRINVFPIRSPSLKERKNDIPLLAEYFLSEYLRINEGPKKFISPIVREKLKFYSWPGNIRELKNIVERMAIMGGQTLQEEHLTLPPINSQHDSSKQFASLREYRSKIERVYIVQTLKKANGNISEAAQLLEVERTYLHKKINQYEIKKKEYFL